MLNTVSLQHETESMTERSPVALTFISKLKPVNDVPPTYHRMLVRTRVGTGHEIDLTADVQLRHPR